ncbi:MAG TPA: sulfur carrier protein ThiS [Hyphomicrobiaceae bacterium]|nr:sulfur carrier protein ThiS [Hyphomicrobiaceae bacterium]
MDGIRQRETEPDPGLVVLSVNGERRETGSSTLEEMVRELGYGDARIATAVNGEFVAAGARAACRLQAGDRVEIVAPRQGG